MKNTENTPHPSTVWPFPNVSRNASDEELSRKLDEAFTKRQCLEWVRDHPEQSEWALVAFALAGGSGNR